MIEYDHRISARDPSPDRRRQGPRAATITLVILIIFFVGMAIGNYLKCSAKTTFPYPEYTHPIPEIPDPPRDYNTRIYTI